MYVLSWFVSYYCAQFEGQFEFDILLHCLIGVLAKFAKHSPHAIFIFPTPSNSRQPPSSGLHLPSNKTLSGAQPHHTKFADCREAILAPFAVPGPGSTTPSSHLCYCGSAPSQIRSIGWSLKTASASSSSGRINRGVMVKQLKPNLSIDLKKLLSTESLSLLKFFGKTRKNDCLRKQSKSVSTYQALESLSRMNGLGAKPTKFVLCTALSSCAKTLNWHLGIQIHAYMIRSGYEDNLFLSSALVDFYAKCDANVDARKVFTGMKIHDQVSWTSLITGFSINGQGRDALLLFKEMLGTQIKPNCFTFASVISACVGQNGALEHCSTLHAHVIKRGFSTSNFVVSSLVGCYANWDQIGDAVLLFDETSGKDTIVYNSMISGYSKNLYSEDALKLFVEMRKKNLSPTDHTLCTVLNACSSLAVLLQGRQVHSLVIKMGSETNVFVASTLINMYSKGGDIDEARCVLDQTSKKNSVLWTSMIMGYTQCGRGSEALELFDRLLTEQEFIPDHVCFTTVLTACSHAGFLDKGVEYFNKMRTNYVLSPDIDQYACMIDLYARNGNLRKARDLIEEMPYDPNYVIWSSLLSSCKIYGDVELGREAADQLIKMEPCNAAPYLTLAHIYARKGLWNEVAEVRSLMQQKRIRKPAGWSLVEVD